MAGPGIGSECELEDAEVTIGRAPENGLVINDNNVSRVHAKVTVAPGNRVVVADNGSRNGVYVNDRKVNQQPINPGDRVVIGQTVIELISDAGARGAKAPASGRAAPGTSGRRPSPNGNGNGREGTDARGGEGRGSANVVPVKGNMARTGTAKP
ncbi:MAG TPA: FHA domain-containing protein, partial [bacterium]|nr:FHA domain-containing protein [bacterium]